MTPREADDLIGTLPKPRSLGIFRAGNLIVMTGGKQGEHSISVPTSNAERLLAHWRGYIQNQGPEPEHEPPSLHVGQWVDFPSRSSRTGWRRGQIMKVTPKRVLLAFRMNRERTEDQKRGLKFDPETARRTWRRHTEIRTRR